MMVNTKNISKSFSINEAHVDDITRLGDKYDMNDSEVVQLGIDLLSLLDERNMTMKFFKMSVEKRPRSK